VNGLAAAFLVGDAALAAMLWQASRHPPPRSRPLERRLHRLTQLRLAALLALALVGTGAVVWS
jgi:hypothetical protein